MSHQWRLEDKAAGNELKYVQIILSSSGGSSCGTDESAPCPRLCLSGGDRLVADVLLFASPPGGLSLLCSADIVLVKASLLLKHSRL